MQIPNSKKLSQIEAFQLLEYARKEGYTVHYEVKKHQLILEKGDRWFFKLFLPWTVSWDNSKGITDLEDSHFALSLIRAGQAAVGYFHQGELIDHRVFRAYMVRQKQGKSQIKHLKTKGKSRAGSRIRLAETERFFEDINQRLNFYNETYAIDKWGVSCAKTLWPYWFDSETPPPFSGKNDPVIELPFHVSQASFEELRTAGILVNSFIAIYADQEQSTNEDLEVNLEEDDDENW